MIKEILANLGVGIAIIGCVVGGAGLITGIVAGVFWLFSHYPLLIGILVFLVVSYWLGKDVRKTRKEGGF